MIERYLAGRAAMVTGGASGQGRAIALALAEHGADVAIGSYLATHGPAAPEEDTYLPPRGDLDAVCHEIMARGGGAVGCDLDVRRTDSVEAFHAAAVNAFGKVDILINVAGVCAEQAVCGHSEPLWLDIIDTNLNGYFPHHARLPARHDRARVGPHRQHRLHCGRRRRQGQPGLLRLQVRHPRPHPLRRAGGRAARRHLQRHQPRLRQYQDAAGVGEAWLAAEGNKRSEEEYIAGIAASYPRKSIIEPEEIGAVAAFLCRDESSGINAQDITVSTGALW
jgi:NAD(P)-dependent dehydrogenase (short-subunit alcohol dehydrogenase family)